jgi:hypothetical protein
LALARAAEAFRLLAIMGNYWKIFDNELKTNREAIDKNQ